MVEIGLNDHVTTFTPNAGMSDGDVLSNLAGRLYSMGLPATFDSSRMKLSLDNPMPDGVVFVWAIQIPVWSS